jgi:hypothetical protein
VRSRHDTRKSTWSLPDIQGTPWFSSERDQAVLLHGMKAFLERYQHHPKKLKQALKAVSTRRFLTKSARIMASVAVESAPALFKDLDVQAPAMLRDHHTTTDAFKARLYKTWRRPLDLLETMIVCCIEGAEAVSDAWPWGESPDDDIAFDVIRRLQVQGCLVAMEVLTLLKAGYPSGAHARWRSLHELAVTASFVREHGKDTAERFLAHEHVEAFKAAELYEKHCRRLRHTHHSAKEMAAFKRNRDAVLQKYGPDFKYRYGWASLALGRACDQFALLEEKVKLDHLRPYYRMASYPVHATAKTIRFSLALGRRRDVLLAGPSNSGLTDPGHSTAISLGQVTDALLILWPTTDSIRLMSLLGIFVDEIGMAFMKAHRALDARGQAIRKRAHRRRLLAKLRRS